MADVFLSYARANAAAANRVSSRLRSSGFSVWFDDSLPVHRAYSEVIEEQLESASAVLVLWSSEAIASQWVRSEANRARESGRLVQARLDDSRLPMPFDQIQCADLRGLSRARSEALRNVEKSIAALAGGDRPAAIAKPPSPDSVSRRTLLIAGGATAALALGGFVAWRELREPGMTPEAQLLLQKGLDALQQNDVLDTEQPVGAGAQAVALLTRATEAAPDSEAAWGGLAMAYAVRTRAAPVSERPGFAERSRAAARRALELEKNGHRALAALRLLEPVYRNWQFAERAARAALDLHPNFPIHIFLLSDVLASVGRWREGANVAIKADRTRFLIPGADRKVIVGLWAAGDLQEADKTLGQAIDRWPEHPQVWRTRIAYLLFSGRPAEALALVESVERPAAIPDRLAAAARATGQALANAGDRRAAVQANLDYLRDSPGSALQIAQAIAALGDSRTAMDLLHGYYFADNEWAELAPRGGDFDRQTSPLFLPPMQSLWKLPEFDRLLERIGLNAYWRRSGTLPDFRRRPL